MKIEFHTNSMKCLLLLCALIASPVAASADTLSAGSIVSLANKDRALSGAQLLKEDPILDSAAQLKANDMMARGYFAHTAPDGRLPWYWFKTAGYYYYKAGENLAMDFTDALTLESAWMHSPAHRANLLKSEFSRVGIGIAHGMYQGRQTTFVVQFFAKPYRAAVARSISPAT